MVNHQQHEEAIKKLDDAIKKNVVPLLTVEELQACSLSLDLGIKENKKYRPTVREDFKNKEDWEDFKEQIHRRGEMYQIIIDRAVELEDEKARMEKEENIKKLERIMLKKEETERLRMENLELDDNVERINEGRAFGGAEIPDLDVHDDNMRRILENTLKMYKNEVIVDPKAEQIRKHIDKMMVDAKKFKWEDFLPFVEISIFDVKKFRNYIFVLLEEDDINLLELSIFIFSILQSGTNFEKFSARMSHEGGKTAVKKIINKLKIFKNKTAGVEKKVEVDHIVTCPRLLLAFEDIAIGFLSIPTLTHMCQSEDRLKMLVYNSAPSYIYQLKVDSTTKREMFLYHIVLQFNFWKQIPNSIAKKGWKAWFNNQIPFLKSKYALNSTVSEYGMDHFKMHVDVPTVLNLKDRMNTYCFQLMDETLSGVREAVLASFSF